MITPSPLTSNDIRLSYSQDCQPIKMHYCYAKPGCRIKVSIDTTIISQHYERPE